MTEPELTEEQLRQLEAELERISVDDVLIQTTVTLLNLAARKAALGAPAGAAPAPDWEQVRQAIEGARAILPLLEARHADQLGPVRDTLARLQMAYAQRSGAAAGPAAEPAAGPAAEPAAGPAAEPAPAASDDPAEAGKPGDPGPAQRSGRLWVPGQ